MDGLAAFVLQAKAACYIGSGQASVSSRPGSHDLRHEAQDWSYLDSYFGGTDFLGQETVWRRGQPVWAMNYYGAVLRADLIDGARAGDVIKTALAAMYRAGRFLGGWSQAHGPYHYHDESLGEVASFTGTETISCDGAVVYRLHYHGGLVRD